MPTSLNEYRLDDATITKLTVEDAVARMMVRNWQDETHVLVFEDVVGIESMSFINASLSHGEDLANDDFLARCCAVGEEQPTEFRCFGFYSAWSDMPILKIVARSFSVTSSKVEPTA
jgi:hypothetical protein